VRFAKEGLIKFVPLGKRLVGDNAPADETALFRGSLTKL